MGAEGLLSEPRTILQLVLIDETGDSYYRMRWPSRDLAAAAPNWRIISLDANAEERFLWAEKADLLILFQSADPDLLSIISRRRAAGKKTIVEYNDNFYAPPVASPVYDAWSSPLTWLAYEKIMKMADALIVTGPGLRELFSKKTQSPIFEIKNQLPDPELPPLETLLRNKRNMSQEVIIGWGGSLGHMPDLLAFLPILRELIAEFPKLKLHLMGNESIPQYLDLPVDRIQFFQWGSMRQYFQFLEALHLGFVPLIDTPYNQCRSDIKAVEMSSRGVLPVLPKFLAYEEFLRETKSHSYISPSELKTQLQSFIRNPLEMNAALARCYDYVKKSRLSLQHHERLDLCLKMMPQKPSDFDWKLPPGYHEISGTQAMHPRYRTTLMKAQNFFNSRQKSEGLQVLSEAREQNPEHPELALAHLKSLKSLGHPGLMEEIKNCEKKFEGDLRFTLLEAELSQNFEDRIQSWEKIIQNLSLFLPFARRHFQEQVIPLAIRDLKENAEFSELVIKILSLFPGAISLRYELARSFEYQGRLSEAHHEFKIVCDAAENLGRNKDFLSHVSLPELRTWLTVTASES